PSWTSRAARRLPNRPEARVRGDRLPLAGAGRVLDGDGGDVPAARNLLGAVEAGVEAGRLDQVLVPSSLDDQAAIEDHDLLRLPHARPRPRRPAGWRSGCWPPPCR